MKKNINNRITVDFSNKIAVVVGGSGSIGSEIARALLEAGAKVISASRHKYRMLSLATRTFEKNKRFYFVKTDVRNEKSIRQLSEEVSRLYGSIDILVLAHGIQMRKPFTKLRFDEWSKIIDTNLTGTFLACKYLTAPMIKKKYGKVIGITSLTSEFGIKNISAYAASKGGMSQFLKTISIELAKTNINVNMIAPGRILTEMTKEILKKSTVKTSNLRCIPMRRFGLPSDLTGAVLFLSSRSSDYLTGQTIYIDGGWTVSIGNPEG